MPSVALWIESAFTLDPLALQLRCYAVRSWYNGRELQDSSHQHLCWNPHSMQLSGSTICTRTSLWVSAATASSRKQSSLRLTVQAKASPTNGNFLNSQQSPPSAWFSEYKNHDVFPYVVVCLASQEDLLCQDSTGTMQFKFKAAPSGMEDSCFFRQVVPRTCSASRSPALGMGTYPLSPDKNWVTDVLKQFLAHRHHEDAPCTSGTKDQRTGLCNRSHTCSFSAGPSNRAREVSLVHGATSGSYSQPRPRSIAQVSVSLCLRGWRLTSGV